MQERALRKVLLIQAIEETDRRGEALPLAERVEATRAVAGKNMPAIETHPEAQLSSATEWLLVRRADALLRTLRERSPGIDHVLAVAGGAASLDRGMLLLSFAVGGLLACIDGRRGINLFALPLIGLIAWNLLVCVWLLGRRRKPRPSLFAGTYARWARGHIDRLLGHSTRFNAPLAPGLRRFAGDWWEVARPLFAVRARRLLHLCAAAVALGLIAGYCLRGFILRSAAGWEGEEFASAGTAHTLLTMLYGPASLLSGIPIPSADEIERLRLTAASGSGGDAAPWVHLIAWTAGLYIVLPRLLAALWSTFNLWRHSRQLPLPPGIVSYARTLFATERFQPGNGEPNDV